MESTEPYRPKRQVLSIIAISASCFALLAVVFLTRYLVLVSLIGIGFGILISPVMTLLQDRVRVPRSLSAIAMVVLTLGGVAGIGYGMFVLLSDQVQSLIDRAPSLVETLRTHGDRIFSKYPWVEQQIANLNLGRTAGTTLSTAFHGLQSSLGALAGLILILTLAIFTAINSRSYFQGLLSLFPGYQRAKELPEVHFHERKIATSRSARNAEFGISSR